ncbi:MAG: hypothetical protein JJV88_05440 [Sulfurovum sp.]|nr:hypothetical protein [Sulfurovaceae bacterium]
MRQFNYSKFLLLSTLILPQFLLSNNILLQEFFENFKDKNTSQLLNANIKLVADKEEVIHGHTLLPEPDLVINNFTLLGIDSNNNGVRDDVERWIYHTYQDKHPIYVDIAM